MVLLCSLFFVLGSHSASYMVRWWEYTSEESHRFFASRFFLLCRLPPISLFPRRETCRFSTCQHKSNVSTVTVCSHCAEQENTKPVRSFQQLSTSCTRHETYERGNLGQPFGCQWTESSTDLVPSILAQASKSKEHRCQAALMCLIGKSLELFQLNYFQTAALLSFQRVPYT